MGRQTDARVTASIAVKVTDAVARGGSSDTKTSRAPTAGYTVAPNGSPARRPWR